MKKTILLPLTFCTLFVFSAAAQANENGASYLGVNSAEVAYSFDGVPEDFKPGALVVRYGKQFDDGLGFEARFGSGMSDDKLTGPGGSISLDVDRILGIYGVGTIQVSDSFSMYGVVGSTQTKSTLNVNTIAFVGSDSESDSGLSFGVGVNIGNLDGIALNLEYMQYLDETDYSIDALSLGFAHRF